MSKLFPLNGFKCIDPTGFDLSKYSRNSSNRCVLKVDLEHPKK